MTNLDNKNWMIVSVLMIFWGVVLIILLGIAQPLPPITKGVYAICMAVTAILMLLDRKPMKGISGALGTFIAIAFGPWSLLIILSTRLIKGYYRKKP